MSWLRFNLTLAVVVAVSVTTAVLQGRMRHRWGTSDAVRNAAARLQEFPQDFGDWHMTAARDLDDDSLRQLECASSMDRVYTNRKTGEKVALLFILGPTGPTAVHTPEVCIGQREFAALGDRRSVAAGNGSDRFWNKRFKSKNVHGESMSVYWAWSTGGAWLAAKDARYAFAGNPYLYKAQITSNYPDTPGAEANGGQRFLSDFVSVAATYLVPGIQD
jgi:hypothetical protein